MEIHKIKDESGGEYTSMFSKDVERVNPLEYYSKSQIAFSYTTLMDISEHIRGDISLDVMKGVALKKAKEQWDEQLKECKKAGTPKNLIAALLSDKKSQQLKLLEGMAITPDQIMSFILDAHEFGFTFSQYTCEYLPADIKRSDLPLITHVDNNKVKKVGDTDLTDKKLMQVIEHRKVTVAKFFDRDLNWACLFVTFDSVAGKEPWKDGQAHLHFISDKFGMPRERVLEELKKRKYSLGSLPHIDLIGYGKQKDGMVL